MAKKRFCLCGSRLPYMDCCGRFHLGNELPKTPEELMRSRYTAYALKKIDYIITTTHPNHPDMAQDDQLRHKQLQDFVNTTQFLGLEIVGTQLLNENEGFVTFHANLKQNGNDLSFTEKSRFKKEGNQWLYHSGEILKK